MGVDERSNSCNGSESGGVVHVVRMRSVRITELNVVLIAGLRKVSEWIVVVYTDDTLEDLGPERKTDHKKVRLGLRTEGTKKSHHGMRVDSSYEGQK